MRILAILVFLCIMMARSEIGFAKTAELRSDNFIISGDVRQKDAQSLLQDLELFRKNVFKVLGVNGSPEIVPVRVYVAKNEKAMKSVTGVGGFDGVYTMTHNGPAFVLNGKAGFRRGGQARHIALHEYTHHIVGTYTELDYPRWYNEGFANYLATFIYKDGVFRIGQPHDIYTHVLDQENWLPMSVVLDSVNEYPFNQNDTSKVGQREQAQFYAQTWLAAHYLRHEEKYDGKLLDYVQRLNKGEENLPAFNAAIGVNPEEFEAELKAYHKKNKYKDALFTTPDHDIAKPTLRDLSPQEAAMAKLSAMRSFTFTPERRDIVIKAYEDYEAEYGKSAESLTAKADLMAYNANSKEAYESAYEVIERALDIDPDNIEANKIAAMILVHQKGRDFGGSQADMEQARIYADKVLAHDAQNPLANYSYALSYEGQLDPPQKALKAASHALDYYRDIGFLGSNLGLSAILLNGEKIDKALPPVKRALIWSKDPNMRVAAQGMLDYIETETARGR